MADKDSLPKEKENLSPFDDEHSIIVNTTQEFRNRMKLQKEQTSGIGCQDFNCHLLFM